MTGYIPPNPLCPTGGAVLVVWPQMVWSWPLGWRWGYGSGCLY
jgi:hypothetical protein